MCIYVYIIYLFYTYLLYTHIYTHLLFVSWQLTLILLPLLPLSLSLSLFLSYSHTHTYTHAHQVRPAAITLDRHHTRRVFFKDFQTILYFVEAIRSKALVSDDSSVNARIPNSSVCIFKFCGVKNRFSPGYRAIDSFGFRDLQMNLEVGFRYADLMRFWYIRIIFFTYVCVCVYMYVYIYI